jgi:hypothetical protein
MSTRLLPPGARESPRCRRGCRPQVGEGVTKMSTWPSPAGGRASRQDIGEAVARRREGGHRDVDEAVARRREGEPPRCRRGCRSHLGRGVAACPLAPGAGGEGWGEGNGGGIAERHRQLRVLLKVRLKPRTGCPIDVFRLRCPVMSRAKVHRCLASGILRERHRGPDKSEVCRRGATGWTGIWHGLCSTDREDFPNVHCNAIEGRLSTTDRRCRTHCIAQREPRSCATPSVNGVNLTIHNRQNGSVERE